MSLEEMIAQTVRQVIREELQSFSSDDRLLTAEQVAEMLGYEDVHSVYRLKKERRLEGVYLGEKTLRFRNSEVQKFMKELAA